MSRLCIASFITGLCKHVHIAIADAGQSGRSVEEMRKDKAMEILREGNYFKTLDGYMEIFDSDGHIGMVNTLNQSCLCVAYSHNIKCVCLLVEELSKVTSESNPVVETCESGYELFTSGTVQTSLKDDIIQKVNDIYSWANSDAIDMCSNNSKISEQVNILYKTIFSSFEKKTCKRKIDPLHPYRNSIQNKKQQKDHQDHSYYGDNSNNGKLSSTIKKVNDDGSFKLKNRNAKCVRNPFTESD